MAVAAEGATGPDRGDPGGLSRKVTLRLLVLLAAASGSLDLLCVARLGGPFSSVVTGNLVQLGRGITEPDTSLAVTSAIAVAGYALGVAVATVLLRAGRVGWHARTSAVAGLEAVLIAGVAGGWWFAAGSPDGALVGVMLALAGGAMGVQSALTLSTGLRGASTTYLTGTLTGVVRGALLARWSRPPVPALPLGRRTDLAGLVRLVALLLGAVASGMVLRFAPLWTPAVPLGLVVVAVLSAVLFGAVVVRGDIRR